MKNDVELLKAMMADSKKQVDLYQPGPFWFAESIASSKKMEKYGITEFRSRSGLIGQGYTDNICEDPSIIWETGTWIRRFLKKIIDTSFFRRFILLSFTDSIKNYYKKSNLYENYFLVNHLRNWFRRIQKVYDLPETTVGGLEDESTVTIDDCKIAKSYLETIARIDNFSKTVDLTKVKIVFEIGGGFGSNAHSLMSLYPNIKKYIYLDVAPMLYVGTQYLKHFYPREVKDYRATKNLKSISIEDNDEREIICIAPWQIEKLDGEIDLFWNASSFQEIPAIYLENYAKHIIRLTKNNFQARICLIVYPTDSSLTIQSKEILDVFGTEIDFTQLSDVFQANLKDPFYYFCGKPC